MDLAEALHPGLIAALQQVAEPDVELYLVGGALRDTLLHRLHRDPWRGLPDIDLLVQYRDPGVDPISAQPAAHALAQRLLALHGSEAVRCQFHHAYGTVELEWHGVWIDLATARHEHYPRPAHNPQVRPGRLEDDLARRDFSVNAMALPLLDLQEEALVDPHGGLVDLAVRQLRLLHGHSVRDDPTRVLRAARYAARLGFALEASSLAQLRGTLQGWPWSWKPGDPADQAPPALSTRLRLELELLLDREPWAEALSQLQQWGALVLLEAGLQRDMTWQRRLRWAVRLGLPRLPALLLGADDPVAVAQRLQLPHRQQLLLGRSSRLLQQLHQRADAAALPHSAAAWSELLETGPDAPLVVQLVLLSSARSDGAQPVHPWRRPLLRWLLRWRQIAAPVTAKRLLEQGYRPGPALGAALKKARADRLAQELC